MLRLNAREVLGENIRRFQAANKMSLETVRKHMGVSTSTASRLLNGDCRVVSHLDGLAILWQKTYVEFFAREGDVVMPLTARENALLRIFRDSDEEGRRMLEGLVQRLVYVDQKTRRGHGTGTAGR